MRRPSPALWAANRAVAAAPAAADELALAVAEMKEVAAGGKGDLRSAAERQRRALKQLTEAATKALRQGRASVAAAQAAAEIVRQAAVAAGADWERLRTGVLTEAPPEEESIFGMSEAKLAPVVDIRREQRLRKRYEEDAGVAKAARARADELGREAQQAARRAGELQKEHEQAAREAERAEARAERSRRELEEL